MRANIRHCPSHLTVRLIAISQKLLQNLGEHQRRAKYRGAELMGQKPIADGGQSFGGVIIK